MNASTFALAAFIAFAYVAWPNLSKALCVSGGLIAFIMVAGALVVLIITSHQDLMSIGKLTTKQVLWITFFAIANGIAVYLYAETAADKRVSTAIFLTMIFVLEVAFAPFIKWYVTGTKPDLILAFGYVLILPGMWIIGTRSG